MTELINTLWNNLGVWTFLSLLIFFLWGAMMGDPGASERGDVILTIICGIIALPVTTIIFLILLIVHIINRSRKCPHDEWDMDNQIRVIKCRNCGKTSRVIEFRDIFKK